MSRKFAMIPLSGDLNEVNYNKVFELGFSGYPIKSSDGEVRSNAHYLYEPKLIGSVINGVHIGYMWVENVDNNSKRAVAYSAFGKHEFIEIV